VECGHDAAERKRPSVGTGSLLKNRKRPLKRIQLLGWCHGPQTGASGTPSAKHFYFFYPNYPVRHRTAIAIEAKPAAPPLRSSYMVSPSSPALGKDESRGIGAGKIKIKVMRPILKLFLREETSCP
jgi:hypothetical protein